jgi:predicted transposase/invertase (TIGR01784 family)
MAAIHDRGYKKLFSNPQMFRQLIETFVPAPWVKDLDFDTCEKLDKTFISDHYKETESDIIYKVKFQGTDAYIYILLEFQSSVVWFMALRVLHYLTDFWLDYAEAHPKVKKLPPIFPLVLYNGEEKWEATTHLTEIIDRVELIGEFAPQFHYFKLAESDYSKETLLQIHNLVSTLFLAEIHYDIELLQQELLTLFDQETDKRAISLLINWFKQLVVHGRRDQIDYQELEKVYASKVEVTTMLEQAIERQRQTWIAQGLQQGLDQGLQQGLEQGLQRGINQQKQEIAKALLAKGLERPWVAEITGLTVEELLLLWQPAENHQALSA